MHAQAPDVPGTRYVIPFRDGKRRWHITIAVTESVWPATLPELMAGLRQRTKRHPPNRPADRYAAFKHHCFTHGQRRCQWCNCPLYYGGGTADHLLPLSRGGSNDWENMVLSCARCNSARENLMPDRVPAGKRFRSVVVSSVGCRVRKAAAVRSGDVGRAVTPDVLQPPA